MAAVLAPGDAFSEVGSNNSDHHLDQPYQFLDHQHESIQNKAERLRRHLSLGSTMEMNRDAWDYLVRQSRSQSRDVMDNIKSAYGERQFAFDVHRVFKRLSVSARLQLRIDLELGCLVSSADFHAILINEALEGNIGIHCLLSSDEAIYSIVFSSTRLELQQIKRSYRSLFQDSIEDDLALHTDGNLKILLLQQFARASGVEANLGYDVEMVDRSRLLYQAGFLRQNIGMIRTSPEKKIIEMAARESKEFLGAIMDIYPHFSSGRTLEMDLSDVNVVGQHGHFEQGILTIMECAKNRPKYFAKLLHKAMSDPNNIDRDAIAKIVAARAKLDMEDIKDEYHREYDRFLRSDVEVAFSGVDPYCKDLLLSLIDWNATN